MPTVERLDALAAIGVKNRDSVGHRPFGHPPSQDDDLVAGVEKRIDDRPAQKSATTDDQALRDCSAMRAR